MLRIAIKARPDVRLRHLYERRNAERSSEHVTRKARRGRVSAVLHALGRFPPCAASCAVPKRFPERAEPQTTFSTGCQVHQWPG